jgi:phosphomannomutase
MMIDSPSSSAAETPDLSPLRFGTDGWRAVIADTFTLTNLDRIAQATARALRAGDAAPRVVIGHDRRFMASLHADRVAEVMVANGFAVLRTSTDLPTPALSGLVVDHEAACGLMLTASHNPPEFGGYKVKSARGGSAAPQFTRLIESHLDREPPRRLAAAEARQRGLWHPVDFRGAYLARLGRRVNREVLKASPRLTVVVDSMHGCGGTLIADFLADCGHRVVTLRGERDVLFGGQGPEPAPDRLSGLRAAVLAEKADLGIATDGDADRIAAIDDTGRFLSALQITPLLAEDRLQRCGETGGLARTCANTLLLDRIAAAHDLPFHVYPIGFKHLVPLLESGELLIGGEESGGIGVSGYLPERDGILIGLLLLEMRAARRLPISHLLTELWQKYGEYHYRRRDLELPAARAGVLVAGLQETPPMHLAGLEVTGIESLDGVKLLLGDDGWIMARPSGTEPVLRLYCEARTPGLVEKLLQALGQHLGL